MSMAVRLVSQRRRAGAPQRAHGSVGRLQRTWRM